MTSVYIHTDENIDKALRRFKKKCNSDGIMDELKKREYYEKPSDKKRRIRKKSQKQAALQRLENEELTYRRY